LTVSLPTSNTGILAAAESIGNSAGVGYDYTSPAAGTAPLTRSFNVNLTPDVAGSYTILVSTNSGSTPALYVAGNAFATYTVTTGAAVSNVALAAVTGSSLAGTTGNGQIFRATITNASGAVAQLAPSETITLRSDKTTTNIGQITNPGGSISFATPGVASVLDSGDFTNGVAYFAVKDATATAVVAAITATGSGLLSSAITSSVTATTVAAVGTTTTGTIGDTATAVRPGSGKVGIATAGATVTDTTSTAATSHAYTLTLAGITAATTFEAIVTDTSGRITGVVGLAYSASVTSGATGLVAVSVTATLATAGNSFIWRADLGTDAQITVTSATAAAATTTLTGGTPATIGQAHGASTALTAVVRDQFGAAVPNTVVSISTTGRNASTTATTLATDANGRVTFTRTDAGTAASANKQDVVTFDGPAGTDPTVTINYGSVAVGTITCTSGAELDTATSVTYRDISSADGAEAGAASLCTVTVRDANGGILVGVPVTVTTASAGAAVLSTSATLYTGAAGTVAPQVYGWTAGAKTFTVTAGTVTSTETINYRQNDAAEVRSISVRADGNRHLVTASDRFGNPVPGVRIYGTRTGSGTFGGGSPTANGITQAPAVVDANTGVAEFIFNGGSTESVVTYQVASAADTPSATFGATDALKGLTDGTTATSTFTAFTAGTVFLAEEGVGASFDAAGVNLVRATIAADTAAADSVSAAADAAAEATDAANAATDAANAAAEAADAATAAAQDAADAVAALSTQVTELVSALRKQITSLTNLVIKIQKKVRA
jgi:hypothetical protein